LASNYDLVVFGGPAGLISAAGTASLGARIALVERDKLGGECLHRECVPTKTLVKRARVASLIDHSEEFGIKASGYKVDFPDVMNRMMKVIESAGEHDSPERFRGLGVETFTEQALFEASNLISVDDRRLATRSAIIATGSHSAAPPIV
jgi:pyruvate/2-oxoglutarate dehydrogenase complex dihydrolipoamide dehydrogenase (E3) component